MFLISNFFSKNETLNDIATSYIPFLSLEHHLALALIASPTTSSIDRHVNVIRAMDLFHSFLRRLDSMEALKPEVQKQYHKLIDMDDLEVEQNEQSNIGSMSIYRARHLGESREDKIARFKLKKAAEEEVIRLKAFYDRRVRLNAEPEEEIDGYDDDGIKRISNVASIHRYSVEAVDEICAALREMEMLKMAVQMERQRETVNKYTGNKNLCQPQSRKSDPAANQFSNINKPLEVTKITQDSTTGKLTFKKEQIRTQVFRPSWNQPTMSLQELADIEVKQAMERSEREKKAQETEKMRPRRYDQLVRDGLEDNADLVEQSAELDRKWDAFKEANPRGCGNKNADKGDRNF